MWLHRVIIYAIAGISVIVLGKGGSWEIKVWEAGEQGNWEVGGSNSVASPPPTCSKSF